MAEFAETRLKFFLFSGGDLIFWLIDGCKDQLHAGKIPEDVGRLGVVGPENNHAFALAFAEFLGLEFQILPNRCKRHEAGGPLLEDAINILVGVVVTHHLRGLAEFGCAFGVALDGCFVCATTK